jgi:hypothetical protein
MSGNDSTLLSFLIPFSWWRRLLQVSRACAMSPSEFAREIIEAEIVRRELLMEQKNDSTLSWAGEINAPSSAQLQ